MKTNIYKVCAVLAVLIISHQVRAQDVYQVSLSDITIQNTGLTIPAFESDCGGSECIDWWNGLGWGAIDPPPSTNPGGLLGSSGYQLFNLDGILVLINKNAFTISNGLLHVDSLNDLSVSNGFFKFNGFTDTQFVLTVRDMDPGVTNLLDLQSIIGESIEIEPSDTDNTVPDDGYDDGFEFVWDYELELDRILGWRSHWSLEEYEYVYIDGVRVAMGRSTIHDLVHSDFADLIIVP